MLMSKRFVLGSFAMSALLMGCQPSDEGVSYEAPSQPDEVALEDGKADRLNSSVRKETTSESLRAKSLRTLACQAVPGSRAVRSLSEDCTNQEFEVTAFYTNEDLIYKGQPMLVAMDVKVSTKEEAVYVVKLVRYFKTTSLSPSWTGNFVEQLVESNATIAEFEELIKDGGAWPDSSYADNFFEVDFDKLPNAIKTNEDSFYDSLEEELKAEYDDDYYIEMQFAYEIKSKTGETLGWAFSYGLSYGNGDGGVTYYFDAEGNYVDEYRYYA